MVRERFSRRRLPLAMLALLLTMASSSAGSGTANAQMPFSDATGRRGMSPYTALGFQGGNPLTGDTLGAYQNLVRPQQLQAAQMRQQQAQGRQLGRMQSQIKSMQRAASRPTSDTIRATGHSATFMNRSHYYPQ